MHATTSLTPPEATPATPIRKLGFAEARMHLMHQLCAGTTQGAAVLRLRGSLEAAAVRRAAEALRGRHDVLRADIRQIGAELWFCRRENDDMPVQVAELIREDEEHWRRVLERENARALKGAEGWWRIILLIAPPGHGSEHELILLSHHAVLDGSATCAVFDELLCELAAESCAAAPGASRPLAPSVEHFTSRGLSWSAYLTRQAAVTRSRREPELMAHGAIVPLDQRITRVLPRSLTLEHSERLRRRSKAAGVSLNSYLSANFLLALRAARPERAAFLLNAAFSLRPLCGARIQPHDLGCYLSVLSTVHCIDDADASAEAIAQDHQSALLAATIRSARNPEHFDTETLAASMVALGQSAQFVQDMAITFLEAPLSRHYGALEVAAFWSSANRAVGNVAAVLQVVDMHGGLHLTLNYVSPLQSDAWAEGVMSVLYERLVERADDPRNASSAVGASTSAESSQPETR